ncbi:MAG: flavin reductase family protein [Anaerolineae bacterium]|nr:flavin reductase family protein [Anaerolineae bacterium]
MTNPFQPQTLELIADNVFKLIGRDWMLVTAGSQSHYNTMTASWGGLGHLWNRNVCFCFVRPQRYTYQFIEETPAFSLSFFDERYRAALELCGSRSGRNVDKAAATGLTPIEITPGIISFAEARLVLECKKIYFDDINPAQFVDPSVAEHYAARDYHRMYIGEITHCWTRDKT